MPSPAADSIAARDTTPAGPGSTEIETHVELPVDSSGVPIDSAFPEVVPFSDIAALRAQAPVVPVAGVTAADLVDSFNDRRGSARRHNAIDIMAARNTPAVAVTAGSVLRLHNSVAGGLSIYLKDRTSRFIFMYGHLDSYRPGLVQGASVRRGEIIGFVGTTGNADPNAPHLHFQVMRSDDSTSWWRGTPINPFRIYRP